MYTRAYKGSDQVSVLGLGCMRLPRLNSEAQEIDYVKAQEIVDYAFASGINYFDTAYKYHDGGSEVFLGSALMKYDRSSFYLATKMPIWEADSPDAMRRIFYHQLERLQTDYFDFYLFHALNQDNFRKCVDFGLYEFLSEKKREGVIRNLGFSFHDSPQVLEQIVDAYEWDFAQIQLNYLDWDMQNAKRQYEILTDHHLPVIVMEPVRGGVLANPCEAANALFREARPDQSIASWAIRYAASLPNVMTVLSGMSTMEQIEDNVRTMTNFEPLTEADYEVIDRAVDAYRKKDTIPCTGCRYCMDCPSGVEIPTVFSLYNQYALNQNKEVFDEIDATARAEQCIACGQCMEHCPQSIPIPEKMAMIAELIQS